MQHRFIHIYIYTKSILMMIMRTRCRKSYSVVSFYLNRMVEQNETILKPNFMMNVYWISHTKKSNTYTKSIHVCIDDCLEEILSSVLQWEVFCISNLGLFATNNFLLLFSILSLCFRKKKNNRKNRMITMMVTRCRIEWIDKLLIKLNDYRVKNEK